MGEGHNLKDVKAKDNGLKLKVNADELKNLSSELAKDKIQH